MNIIFYIVKFVYHIRYWLLIVPILVALLVFWYTRKQELSYAVQTSIYTGVISGRNSIVEDPELAISSVQNAKLENMIALMTSTNTLQKVAIRLFATNMIYGDTQKDNTYIQASHYAQLVESTPDDVKKLIDKSSVDKTVENLTNYIVKDPNNYIYGLLNWQHPHYSYAALSKILVKRQGFSDILNVSYSTNDPGIAYNTLKILTEVFVDQYDELQFTGANDVILFFQEELRRVQEELEKSENELTYYNVENKIINYGEQTKQVAAMNRDLILNTEDVNLKYSSSKALVENLEKKLGSNVKLLKTNNEFLSKLQRISYITSLLTKLKSFEEDTSIEKTKQIQNLEKELQLAEDDFKIFVNSYYNKEYSKEGYPNKDITKEWLDEVLKLEGYSAQKKELEIWKNKQDELYTHYSPIGAEIKRRERHVNFTETSYLAVLKGLHDAMLRQKNMSMMSATLKVLTPPNFPLSAMPTKRKIIVAGSYFGSLIFILAFFLLLNFLNQTLRDKLRTKRITGCDVIGAYPLHVSVDKNDSGDIQKQIAIKYLANSLINYFRKDSPQIINLISIEPNEGKTEIAQQLQLLWQAQGLKVKYVNWKTDMASNTSDIILGKSVKDFVNFNGQDILLIEYPDLKRQTISKYLLREVTFNLLVVQADRTWKEVDKALLTYLTESVGEAPLMIELNKTRLSAVEEFTGLLPPYPPFRKFAYRLLNVGLGTKEDIS